MSQRKKNGEEAEIRETCTSGSNVIFRREKFVELRATFTFDLDLHLNFPDLLVIPRTPSHPNPAFQADALEEKSKVAS